MIEACFMSSAWIAVEHVLVRVVGAGRVLDRVLDELEAGQAEAVERKVVGPPVLAS